MQAGAELVDSLSESDIILGIKEVPNKEMLADKTYLYFSHTHKGQAHNLPCLREMIKKVYE